MERCDEYARLPLQEPYEQGYFEGSHHSRGGGGSNSNRSDNNDGMRSENRLDRGDDSSLDRVGGGNLVIDRLTVKYPTAADPALRELSLSVGGGLRVGVVGRTGAGKSTLAAALFRLVDHQKGSIMLDGVDICR